MRSIFCFLACLGLCLFCLFGISQPIQAQIFGLPDLPSNCDPCAANAPCPAGEQLYVLDRTCTESNSTRVKCPICLPVPLAPLPSWCNIPIYTQPTCTTKQSLMIDGASGFGMCEPPVVRCIDPTCSAFVDSPYPHGAYFKTRCNDCCPNEPTSCASDEDLVLQDRRCDTRTIQCNTCQKKSTECKDASPGIPLPEIKEIKNVNDNAVYIIFSKGSDQYSGMEIAVGDTCGSSNLGSITLNSKPETISNDERAFTWTLGKTYSSLQGKCFRLTVVNGCSSARSNDYIIPNPNTSTNTPTPTPSPKSTTTVSRVDDLPVTGAKETTFLLLFLGGGILGGGAYLHFKNK